MAYIFPTWRGCQSLARILMCVILRGPEWTGALENEVYCYKNTTRYPVQGSKQQFHDHESNTLRTKLCISRVSVGHWDQCNCLFDPLTQTYQPCAKTRKKYCCVVVVAEVVALMLMLVVAVVSAPPQCVECGTEERARIFETCIYTHPLCFCIWSHCLHRCIHIRNISVDHSFESGLKVQWQLRDTWGFYPHPTIFWGNSRWRRWMDE